MERTLGKHENANAWLILRMEKSVNTHCFIVARVGVLPYIGYVCRRGI